MIESAISLAQGQGGVPEMCRGWGRMERVKWVNGGFTLNSSVRNLDFVHPGHRAYGTSDGPVQLLLCNVRKYLANQRPRECLPTLEKRKERK